MKNKTLSTLGQGLTLGLLLNISALPLRANPSASGPSERLESAREPNGPAIVNIFFRKVTLDLSDAERKEFHKKFSEFTAMANNSVINVENGAAIGSQVYKKEILEFIDLTIESVADVRGRINEFVAARIAQIRREAPRRIITKGFIKETRQGLIDSSDASLRVLTYWKQTLITAKTEG